MILLFSAESVPVGTAYATGLNIIASGVCSKNGCRCLANTSGDVLSCLDARFFSAPSFSTSALSSPAVATGIKNYSNATKSSLNSSAISKSKPVPEVLCSSIFYLSTLDTTTDNSYLNRTVILTGGPGQGQIGKIARYDAVNKMATMYSDWQMSTFSVPNDSAGDVWWKIGTVRILKGGSGYTNGVWRLPKKRFVIPSAVEDEGWGTFYVNHDGAIVDIKIWNVGFYGSINGTDGAVVGFIDPRDISCSCPQSNLTDSSLPTAVLEVNWYTRQVLAPSTSTSYIIVGEEPKSAPSMLHYLPFEPQHSTLVCDVPPGEGTDAELLVESYYADMRDSEATSCPTPGSRGFEYGAMDFVWSLQVEVRQPLGIKSLTIAALNIDQNNGDIYLVANIVGSCEETVQGCMGFVSSFFPNRGLYASGSFQPLSVSPLGATAAIVAKLNKDGQPLWLTQIDSSDSLGQVQASSMFVDSTVSPTRICISGLYITDTEYNLRFWHVNPKTNLPYALSRIDAAEGRGRCNRAICNGGLCTMHAPVIDSIQCVINPSGFKNITCVPMCAYREEYPSTLPTTWDIFLAEISPDGQFSWTKSRISTGQESAIISSALIAPCRDSLNEISPDSPSFHDLYLALTVTAQNISVFPSLTFGINSVAIPVEDSQSADPFQISIPPSPLDNNWAVLVKLKGPDVIWARLLGPLGNEGALKALKVRVSNLMVYCMQCKSSSGSGKRGTGLCFWRLYLPNNR